MIIPCSTIEDFPSRLDSAGARSLLGGLTAAWHPRLLACTGQTPTWHRSDDSLPTERAFVTDPEPEKNEESASIRLLIVPEVCVPTLPIELAESLERDAISHHVSLDAEGDGDIQREVRVRVSSRTDAIEKIVAACKMIAGETQSGHPRTVDPANDLLDFNSRIEDSPIDERDFFALGYMWWQTQVLTRRLRYTSNLDQIHFENRLTAAAEKYLAGEIKPSIEALHDCFDALAEERDHYFSSDPAIIDLTLLTPGTLDDWLATPSADCIARPEDSSNTAETAGGRESVLPTPANILVDEAVAEAILSGQAERREQFQSRLGADGSPSSVGWCGGGPSDDFRFDHSSIAHAEERIAEAIRKVRSAGNADLSVYARLGGGIAGEWVPPIAAAGFQGIIPIDFLGGRGFDDESKVILGEQNTEIEALTAKPIDADDESSFLTLSTQLGEAIDRGEIATALLVHWPGGGCDSFHDVRRAASWSLCLGRFWRIDDYFVDGERPFHHGGAPKASPAKCETMAQVNQRRDQLAADLNAQRRKNLRGFAALIDPASIDAADVTEAAISERIAHTLGFDVDAEALRTGATPGNSLMIHPDHPALRTEVSIAGKVPGSASSVFHASADGEHTNLIVDLPAWGFAMVGTDTKKQSGDEPGAAKSTMQKITRWFSSGPGQIVEANRLSNEFMEVSIHPEHGGIEGVYSGPGRGNRFSTRILLAPSTKINTEGASDANVTPWRAVCKTMETLVDSRSSAILQLSGDFQRVSGGTEDVENPNSSLTWQSQYRLDRGSRRLLFSIRFSAVDESALDVNLKELWKRNPVLRIATAEANPIIRTILREKLVRINARSFQTSLGYVIDEGERTTLVASDSATVHRCVGDRFFDTLLTPLAARPSGDADSQSDFTEQQAGWSDCQSLSFGFDVRHPVASAKSFACGDGVNSIPVQGSPTASSSPADRVQRGWLIHPSPLSLDVQVVDIGRVEDEAREFLALQIRIIQTASRSASASLRFCRDVHSAHQVSSLSRPFGNQESTAPMSQSRLKAISHSDSLQVQGDCVKWSQPSHGVVHLIVLFTLSEQT